MDKKDILKKIIEEKGNCSWSNANTCRQCPLSRLKSKPDGNFYSCLEAVGANDLTEEEADKAYLEAASRALLEIEIETILEK